MEMRWALNAHDIPCGVIDDDDAVAGNIIRWK